MKRIALSIALLLQTSLCASLFAQSENKVREALDDIEQFVNTVSVSDSTSKEEMDSINAIYKDLTKEYKAVRKTATDAEAQEYYRLTTKYKKKVSPYYLNKTGETIEKGANSVAKWTKRQYQKAKGAVEGLKE